MYRCGWAERLERRTAGGTGRPDLGLFEVEAVGPGLGRGDLAAVVPGDVGGGAAVARSGAPRSGSVAVNFRNVEGGLSPRERQGSRNREVSVAAVAGLGCCRRSFWGGLSELGVLRLLGPGRREVELAVAGSGLLGCRIGGEATSMDVGNHCCGWVQERGERRDVEKTREEGRLSCELLGNAADAILALLEQGSIEVTVDEAQTIASVSEETGTEISSVLRTPGGEGSLRQGSLLRAQKKNRPLPEEFFLSPDEE
ncbi:hypothetical protein MLD38_031323 [Melastoma candidum]|uniref:Uncharacterized protein n=1 Tax=Melastoma candidum TaxID=119954 RepID=A0ACB9MPW4_9MYRT|nr:hypothetical protein MLD38_031323 [Melastoma candidum]